MPAADETEVVATSLTGRALADLVFSCWDAGEAVAPLPPSAPAPERARLLAILRPTQWHDADGRRSLADGVPVAADTAAVVTTSGTTGAPKGVELTRTGMDVMGRGYSAGVAASADDNWLACLPLYHVASLGVLARSFVTGVPFTVHDTFDAERVAAAPRAEGATIVSLVPTTVRRLLNAAAPLHEYRCVIVGGAPCPSDLRARAEGAGVRIVDAYGLTETWSGCALNGVPIAGADMRADEATGEILVRGAMVMRGYRLDPAGTKAAIDTDGWLHTGDVGTVADGRVRVVDRLKDIVISGGVNVSPTEVEGVLGAHPGVADVCVVGVPDDEWGERVVAFVVARDGGAPSVDDLRDYARDHLSAAKLPREVRAVAEIPRSGSGKPLRRVLRGEA